MNCSHRGVIRIADAQRSHSVLSTQTMHLPQGSWSVCGSVDFHTWRTPANGILHRSKKRFNLRFIR